MNEQIALNNKNMKNTRLVNFAIWFVIFAGSVALDQFSKFWAKNHLPADQPITIISGILNLRLVFNTGAAFSAMSGQTGLLVSISLIASIGLIVYSLKQIPSGNKILICSLALITAGAVGNLIDRALFTQVTDFIDLLILPGNFPVFNVADTCINCGVALYIIDLLVNKAAKA